MQRNEYKITITITIIKITVTTLILDVSQTIQCLVNECHKLYKQSKLESETHLKENKFWTVELRRMFCSALIQPNVELANSVTCWLCQPSYFYWKKENKNTSYAKLIYKVLPQTRQMYHLIRLRNDKVLDYCTFTLKYVDVITFSIYYFTFDNVKIALGKRSGFLINVCSF